MKRILTAIAIVISLQSFSQQKIDSVQLWNAHLDSALSKTSIKDFQVWLYENATVKQYQESKFVDLYNAYVQYRYQLWISRKSQPKSK